MNMNIIVTDYFETQGTLKAFKTARQALRYAFLRSRSTGERLKVLNKVTKRVYSQNDLIHKTDSKQPSKAFKMTNEAYQAHKNRKRLSKSHNYVEQTILKGNYKPKGRPVNVRLDRVVTISDKAITSLKGRKGKIKTFEHKDVKGFAKASRYYLDVQDYVKRKEKGLTNV